MTNFLENPILIILISFLFIIILLGLIFYLSDFFKIYPIIKKILLYLKKYLFIIFLIPAIAFLSIDFYFIEFKNVKNYELIKELCKILFSAGVFTTALNFLDSLDVFKKNFKSIIMSDEFESLLTKKIDALAYSEEHLNKQSNLDKIWQTVTLCKYRQEFPELYDKLENKIENLLFKKNNISYYYKNFQVNYHFELIDDKYVKILEKTSFTIMRPNKNEFTFDFKSSYNNEDKACEVKAKFFSKNVKEINFEEIEISTVKDKTLTTLTCSKILSGHLEYHIESDIEMYQNIEIDRTFTFSSGRIIDDLTIFIEKSNKINVTFVPLNNNKFHHNGIHNTDKISYINRDVLLSGEKFIIFFYRNN
jgi:hypothetical protein